MNLPLFISGRYLFAKKSHNVINLIAGICTVGLMAGTAALVIIMSVMNGFEDLTKSLYGTFDPHIKISPKHGKTIQISQIQKDRISQIKGVNHICEVLEENVLLKFDDYQTLAIMRGVDKTYEETTLLNNAIYDGAFQLHFEGEPMAVLGHEIAAKLGMFSIRFDSPLYLYVPKRGKKVSMQNPSEDLNMMELYSSGIFALEQSFDSKYMFVPIEFAQQLLDYDSATVTALEITVDSLANFENIKTEVIKITNDSFDVKTRYEQNTALYRMLKTEKAAVYFILIFIIVILSFNIYGSLLMLIIEKKKDIKTLSGMGANKALIRQIFMYEGLLISFSGIFTGLLLGVTICLLQQQFGFVKLPGSGFILDAYPVTLKIVDLIIIITSVSVIGYASALMSVWGLQKMLKTS